MIRNNQMAGVNCTGYSKKLYNKKVESIRNQVCFDYDQNLKAQRPNVSGLRIKYLIFWA